MSVDHAAIRDQLEKILGSESFATAGRHSRLLRYLVERTLAGEGEQLKEYVLGTEVFDRPESYDPRLDSIVRVEVRRLRTRLDEYYNSVGRTDHVLITIPRGTYVPLFETARSEPPEETPRRDERRSYSPAAIIAAAASVLIVVVAGLAVNQSRDAAQASATPDIAVLPFEHFSTNEQDTLAVAHLTDAVTAELARAGGVSVASRTSASQYAGRRVAEIAEALNVDFVMETSAVVTGDVIHVVTRVIDGRTDRKVWVGEYDVRRSEIATTAPHIAREAAAGTLKHLDRQVAP